MFEAGSLIKEETLHTRSLKNKLLLVIQNVMKTVNFF